MCCLSFVVLFVNCSLSAVGALFVGGSLAIGVFVCVLFCFLVRAVV